jgi:signal transduction histidine kinase
MLHEFLSTNRLAILALTWDRVSARDPRQPASDALRLGIEEFLDDLIATLRTGRDHSNSINRDATLHGERLQRLGYPVAQVVHGYGDVCQVVTQLAIEGRAGIDVDEFRILNRCLDDAIAFAVTEHGRRRELSSSAEVSDRLGALAHELRNALHTADLGYTILRSGRVAIGGSTGEVLGRSLGTMQSLIDRALVQVRLDAGGWTGERLEVSTFLDEAEAAGSLAALDQGISLSVDRGESGVRVEGDRQLLGSAISNLLQNAFKFTPKGGAVALRTVTDAERVLIEVEDECGGLDPGQMSALLDGMRKRSGKGSGLGLGLVISKRAVEAMGGNLRARNRPDIGCVLVIDLPRCRAEALGHAGAALPLPVL